MTLPDERYRSIVQTRELLQDILKTPRVPAAIKESARYCLRHYPTDWEMKCAAAACPEVFAEKMEDLHRMIVKHSLDKDQEL